MLSIHSCVVIHLYLLFIYSFRILPSYLAIIYVVLQNVTDQSVHSFAFLPCRIDTEQVLLIVAKHTGILQQPTTGCEDYYYSDSVVDRDRLLCCYLKALSDIFRIRQGAKKIVVRSGVKWRDLLLTEVHNNNIYHSTHWQTAIQLAPLYGEFMLGLTPRDYLNLMMVNKTVWNLLDDRQRKAFSRSKITMDGQRLREWIDQQKKITASHRRHAYDSDWLRAFLQFLMRHPLFNDVMSLELDICDADCDGYYNITVPPCMFHANSPVPDSIRMVSSVLNDFYERDPSLYTSAWEQYSSLHLYTYQDESFPATTCYPPFMHAHTIIRF